MTRSREISEAEWQAVQEMRLRKRNAEAYNRGLEDAATLAERWGDESGGGSGEGGSGYCNLATAIRKMMR
jgi:hypothetical protein